MWDRFSPVIRKAPVKPTRFAPKATPCRFASDCLHTPEEFAMRKTTIRASSRALAAYYKALVEPRVYVGAMTS